MNRIEKLNSLSAEVGTWAVSHLVGTAAVLLLVAMIWLVIKKQTSTALGCWLFLLVLAKPLIPFEIGVPHAWVPFNSDAPAAVFESALLPATAVAAEPVTVAPPPVIAPEVATPKAPKLIWQSFAMIAWVAVVVLLLGRFALLQWRTGRWLKSCSRLTEMEKEIAALATEVGLRRRVRVFSSAKLDTPMVCGLLRPSLLLPRGFSEQLETDQRRWVLLHELAHLKRSDLWVLAFQRLTQIAFFFNPSVWMANRAINRLREYACDDVALIHSKIDRRSCGEGFLRVVERAHLLPISGAAALALFERRSDSKRRLARILDSRRQLAGGIGLGGIAFLLALGLVVLPGLRAQEAVGEIVPDGSDDVREIPSRRHGLFSRIDVADAGVDVPVSIGLVLKADGKIYESGDNEKAIPNDWLINDLRKARELNPKVAVIISADRTAKYSRIMALFAEIQKAGIGNISILTGPDAPRTVIRGYTFPSETVQVDEARAVPAVLPAGSAVVEQTIEVREIPSALGGLFRRRSAASAVVAEVVQREPEEVFVTTKFVEVDQSPQGPHRLATAVAGIVAEVLVKPGASVEKGDVLLKLDARQAEAALRVAMTKLELADEQSKLAEQQLQDANAELQGIEKKFEAGEVDGFRVAMSQTVVAKLQKLVAPRALAAAELDQARIALEQVQIVAPVGGTIESVEAKLGEYVSPEKPVILLRRKAQITVIPATPAPDLKKEQGF